MSTGRVLVFGSSVRPGCMNERVLKLVESRLKTKGYDIQIIDPKQFKLPLIENPFHFYPNRSKVPQEVQELNAAVVKADAYVIVTAEYNRCMPPALTNLLDHVSPTFLSMKPAGIISYSIGSLGGSMSNGQVRQLMSELGCLVMPHFVTIAQVQRQISENGEAENVHLIPEIDFLIDQIDYVIKARQSLEKNDPSVKTPKPHP